MAEVDKNIRLIFLGGFIITLIGCGGYSELKLQPTIIDDSTLKKIEYSIVYDSDELLFKVSGIADDALWGSSSENYGFVQIHIICEIIPKSKIKLSKNSFLLIDSKGEEYLPIRITGENIKSELSINPYEYKKIYLSYVPKQSIGVIWLPIRLIIRNLEFYENKIVMELPEFVFTRGVDNKTD